MKKILIYVVIVITSMFFITNSVSAIPTKDETGNSSSSDITSPCIYKGENLSVGELKNITVKVTLNDNATFPIIKVTYWNNSSSKVGTLNILNYNDATGASSNLKSQLEKTPNKCPNYLVITKVDKLSKSGYLTYTKSDANKIKEKKKLDGSNSVTLGISALLSGNKCSQQVESYTKLIKNNSSSLTDAKTCTLNEENLKKCQTQLDNINSEISSAESIASNCINSGNLTTNDEEYKNLQKAIVDAKKNINEVSKKINYIESSGDAYVVKVTSCGNVDNIPISLPRITRNFYNAIKILVPIAVILFGIYDFFKASISNDEKSMAENARKFVRRLIAGILILLVMAIVQFAFGLIPDNGDENGISDIPSCIACFISDENSCGAITVFEDEL